ncbi:peptidase M13 [Microbacterium sp. EYE_5]|uniref:M13 family metallopeptidase n=1 Tax=unclassified Microbacterium TaxID=2609290 RepID=UPI002004793D|nr:MULTISPECIES: M13-type metalloendopeptidase [unclassified Microbacterium]MCK6079254.1 peptidase M13 [Microbacterium sp. EYE_382]MCK6084524.1 peptidase M13 [Microbacterium sp. EYE_384]MCK6123247.1 peptidase M13 [Microbacterium sp. EYE_80]MCK6125288.1 peptidase M13 [Microbacterium sp. EYE_79]MCK6140208.1 peptidase M13 [Microbacterium sp. EYE_39]
MTENTLPSGIQLDELSADVRPQDDLFRHVNGAWLERTEIPEDKARWGSFHLIAEQAEHDVREIIQESTSAEPGTEARKIGDLFTSFMDTEAIEARGAEALAPQLAQVEAVTGIPSLLHTAGTLEREGVAGVFGTYIEPDPGNPQRYVMFLVQGGLSLPDESYYRLDNFEKTRTAFRAYVATVFGLAGVADAEAQADRVVALETEIASHHWDNVRSRDAVATYNLMTWDAAVQLTGVDLAPWRDAVAPGKAGVIEDVDVNQPSFFEGLGTLLVEDRLEDWKAWLRLQVIRSAAPFLSQPFVDANFAFYGTEMTGVPVNRERWKRGVSLVEAALGEAVGKVYVERHFPPQAKEEMDVLVDNLIEAYRQSISSLEWMTPATRERALEKLEAFTPKVGYPVKWKDYSDLGIEASDLIGNVRRSNAWQHDQQLAKLGAPIDRDEWFMTPQTVNAYYNPLMNEIVFPAAILQHPFFDLERDPAANYGGIGAVIGHEIGHGFDDQGSAFDGTGALNDWWTDEDRAAFTERTKTLIEQYNALVPQGLSSDHTVNGALTIGENIGDLGGLGIAIKAYRLHLQTTGSTDADGPVIDGLTGIQRLLLSWGQIWQQKGRDAETIRLLTIDPHSPNEFRCNQIVRNIDEFYAAFEVTPSDELWLDEDKRVTIW